MMNYRLLPLDDDGRMLDSRAIERETDQEATNVAESDAGPLL